MAGRAPQLPHTAHDPVLEARLEAIRVLAEHQTERVMVIGPDQTVIYANRTAWPDDPQPLVPARPAKCYQAVLQRNDPCGTCPAMEVFASGEVKSFACSSGGDGHACGISQVHPLKSGAGQTDSVLVLFRNGSERTKETAYPETQPVDTISEGLDEMLGISPSMQRLFEMVRLIADSQATVLIQGESGTGKELVARTIHRLSSRRKGRLVVVECSSLPETLLESELFGHVKGAFTGAVTSRRGLFEEADGGTILLDEIADTSPSFQAKLLRVLQEGEIKPVGSSRSSRVDVRVISATNKDLFDLVKAKQFREDLYYRLAVLPLFMPPLRERTEDVPVLVSHFIERSSRRHRRPMRTVDPDAMQALLSYHWPGNVRELLNLIERVVVTAQGSVLSAIDFFGEPDSPPVPVDLDLHAAVRDATAQAERLKILEALQRAGGNRVKAARLLGISRAGLYNKLRTHQIESH
ncbi:hypothetical protein YTPLAS18_37380 [Nitrospira sp.]|nr:hypothetical protein YTPLAS18_37380 [Nitrospira sp.]